MNPRSYIRFSVFKKFPNLICVFSTRIGGSSKGIYASQNMGLKTGDDASTVINNRNQFFSQFGISDKDIAFSDQIHSAKVVVADQSGIYPASDALITSRKNLFLAIQTADCFPIFIFDPVRLIIAAIHAGWRGVQAGIIPATIKLLTNSLELNPKNLYAAIGPGLQKECFEVRSDVSRHFPQSFLSDHSDPEKKYLDLSGYIRRNLIEQEIETDHIETNGSCTMCNQESFYSYRRDKDQSGRMIGLIGIR